MPQQINEKQNIQIVRLEERLKASDEAKALAYAEMQRRLEGMNEFRQQLNDQTKTFITKLELCAVEERIGHEVKLVRNRVDWILWILIISSLMAIAISQIFR
jgi:hypothetical protein